MCMSEWNNKQEDRQRNKSFKGVYTYTMNS